MIYLCAGVFAEGASDYAFLLPLVTRVLYEVSTAVPQLTEVADAVGIDAPRPFPRSRAERIAKAILEYKGQCSLFVIHADADGDRHAALRDRIEPGKHAAGVASPIAAGLLEDPKRTWPKRFIGDDKPLGRVLRTTSDVIDHALAVQGHLEAASLHERGAMASRRGRSCA